METNKSEKLQSFFNNIAHTLFFTELDERNYNYLIETIPAYIKTQLDIKDIAVVFENMAEDTFGRYRYSTKQVELSKSKFEYRGEELVINLKQIYDLVITTYHELFHALDFNAPKGQRTFLNQSLALEHLAKFIPEHKEIYEKLQSAIYHNSRVETFARQGAKKYTSGFIDDLKTYAKQNIKITEKEEHEYQLVKECAAARQNGEDLPYPEISENGRIFTTANLKMQVFDGLFEFEEKKEIQLTNLHCTNEMTYGYTVNKDLEEISEKLLKQEIQVEETALFDITESQLHSILYNKTTAQNLRQYALNTNDDYIIYFVEDRLNYAKNKNNQLQENQYKTDEKNTM